MVVAKLSAGSNKAAAATKLPAWPSSHISPVRPQQHSQGQVESKPLSIACPHQQQHWQHGDSDSGTRRVTCVAAVSPAAAADALRDAAATTSALLDWMQQQGCVVHGLELQYGQGEQGQIYRELKASKVISGYPACSRAAAVIGHIDMTCILDRFHLLCQCVAQPAYGNLQSS
jgi:hypothetical protein